MSNIIAVDFDGCLCENKYPDTGKPIQSVIDALKAQKEQGAKVILWTCRVDAALEAAIEWCKEQGIEFDEVNRNTPDMISFFGGSDTRKVFANEYWDDRAVKMPTQVTILDNRNDLKKIEKELENEKD